MSTSIIYQAKEYAIIIDPPPEESPKKSGLDHRVAHLANRIEKENRALAENTPLTNLTEWDFLPLDKTTEDDDIVNYYFDEEESDLEVSPNSDFDEDDNGEGPQPQITNPSVVIVNSYRKSLSTNGKSKESSYRPSSRVPQNQVKIHAPKRAQGSWISNRPTPEELYELQISDVARDIVAKNGGFNDTNPLGQTAVKEALGQLGYGFDDINDYDVAQIISKLSTKLQHHKSPVSIS